MLIPEGHHLFIIDLTYVAGAEKIDLHRTAHMAFVATCLADGFILLSGPKVPRDGGVIVAVARDLAAAQARMAEDPFVIHGLVAVTYTEVDPGTRHPTLRDL
ncbi:YciI family protein [Sagittula salina]|uniref:YCII-related domain-containing protein n=1 Tax=Sagittula salina TaxID=2820268 RepID=A0A940MP80_9RHOB|nr:YciI family protein [Sagittula salina]MBP0483268.1 hypothetical protein [Sagittula salina]